jgi:hypothetical protein
MAQCLDLSAIVLAAQNRAAAGWPQPLGCVAHPSGVSEASHRESPGAETYACPESARPRAQKGTPAQMPRSVRSRDYIQISLRRRETHLRFCLTKEDHDLSHRRRIDEVDMASHQLGEGFLRLSLGITTEEFSLAYSTRPKKNRTGILACEERHGEQDRMVQVAFETQLWVACL